ncbi:bZIP transcription factor [Macrococcus caseolyticus]|nr:bZIP transcription factor [Macrococcus caseolyticus]RKO12027.1 bZIP transcription factor [Macrococcus caseolyticus]
MSTELQERITIKQEITMNQTELNAFSSLPPRFSKHQGVFGKYAASEAAILNGWNSDASALYSPCTPVTPSLVSIPGSVNMADTELLTPDSLRTVSSDELLSADNSPLFDELSIGEMQNWESLFLDDSSNNEATAIPQGQLVSPEECIEPAQMLVIKPEESFNIPPSCQESLAITDSFDLALLDESRSFPEHQTPPSAPKPVTKAVSPAGGVSKSSSKKLDDLGFTMYKRKPRTLPLKPVEIPEDGDDLSAKRAKNTEAARRSRARKLERMSQLEDRVRELLDENETLKEEIAQLKAAGE